MRRSAATRLAKLDVNLFEAAAYPEAIAAAAPARVPADGPSARLDSGETAEPAQERR